MLLIIEALLLSSVALGQDHRIAEEQIFPLDMAPDSVDDQYFGCREDMKKQVETNYLEKELNNSEDFKKAWQESEKEVSRDWFSPKLTKKHKIALYIYSHPNISNIQIYRKFNNDTRHGKQNYTERKYTWYSLQFLLTDAIQILKKTQKRCFNTFRGTNDQFNGSVFTEVRFGSFTSSSLYRGRAKSFGKKSCFEIHTCEGVHVTNYSRHPYEKEVLIPPYETFKITAAKTRQFQANLWCETVFVLKSTGTRSALNCALFNN
ncbi:erythroblast NAD(P)(+)--arginine ADP-ribosyltransferase-like [Pseudorasbora parva]|uniref:erythroblast NAD(P)(+)--arginine ADP-ribosyltransferase-like n=1 Tax=Pseudorasbora parva TaxID=51549 RepID=UPI00351E187B